VEEKLVMHKRSARSLHLNGSVKSGATSLFGGGGSLVLPTANNAGTIFKASGWRSRCRRSQVAANVSSVLLVVLLGCSWGSKGALL